MFEYDEHRREEREESKAARKKVFAWSFGVYTVIICHSFETVSFQLFLAAACNLRRFLLNSLPDGLLFLLMQIKLEQEKQKESFLTGAKSFVQESENFAKLRADALKASTAEPSSTKEPASEGAFSVPFLMVHICLSSL